MPATKVHPEIRVFLKEIYMYCKAYNVTKTGFGLEVVNDGHFVPRLEQGRNAHMRTVANVREYIRKPRRATTPSKRKRT
jgi:hypothetical protein